MTMLDRAITDLENIARRVRDNIAEEQSLIAEIAHELRTLRKIREEFAEESAAVEFPA